jgi:YVTN family beta-propeller protein
VPIAAIDLTTNQILAAILVDGPVVGLASHPTNGRLYAATGSTNLDPKLCAIDTRSNTIVATAQLERAGTNGLAVHPVGGRVYVSQDQKLLVFDAATLAPLATITLPYGTRLSRPVLDRTGARLYLLNADFDAAQLLVVDTATNALSATLPLPARQVFNLALSPDDRTLYVLTAGESRVMAIDTTTRAIVGDTLVGASSATDPSHGIAGIAVHPNGSRLYVVNDVGTMSVLDTTTHRVVATLLTQTATRGIAISADGSRLYGANSATNTFSVVDTNTNTITALVQADKSPLLVALVP